MHLTLLRIVGGIKKTNEGGGNMEILLGLIALIFAISCLLDKAKDFIKQLKSSGSAKLNKGFEAQLSIMPIHKKSEDVHSTTSTKND